MTSECCRILLLGVILEGVEEVDVNWRRSLLVLSEFLKLILTRKGVKTDPPADVDDLWSAEAAAVDPVEEDGRPGIERPAGKLGNVGGEVWMMSDEDSTRPQWSSHSTEVTDLVTTKSSSGE